MMDNLIYLLALLPANCILRLPKIEPFHQTQLIPLDPASLAVSRNCT